MKKIFSLTLFTLLILSAFSQKFSVAADKNNILYIGVDNPLTISVENYHCNSIVVKTDNGSVVGKSCDYIYRGGQIGKADIILYAKKNGQLKEIGRSSFRVKRIPDPIPKVGSSYGGNIKRIILANQQYLRSDIETFDFQAGYRIDSFTVCIIRGDTCLYNDIFNISGKFDDQVAEALQAIKKNDTVIFKKIHSTGPDNVDVVLSPILFFVID